MTFGTRLSRIGSLTTRLATVAGLAIYVVLGLVAGCDRHQEATYGVSGTIMDAGGNPAVGAVVVFRSLAVGSTDAVRPSAVVDEHGAYRLTTYRAGDGAPPGDYAITVIWPSPRRTPFDAGGGDRLHGELARVTETSPRMTVVRQPNQTAPAIVLDEGRGGRKRTHAPGGRETGTSPSDVGR
jgi:hypothetical protein